MQEADVDLLFEEELLSISIDTINANKILFSTKELSTPIETRFVVDATGDAKI